MDKDHNKRRTTLISLFSKNRFSKETEDKVQKWLIGEEHAAEKQAASEEYWNSLHIPSDDHARQTLEKINRKIGKPGRKAIRHPFFFLSRVAAVMIPLFLISGLWFYFQQQTEWITIQVANAGTQEIFLPDGSRVLLNGGSTLRYPEQFTKDNRTIYLAGEGWFEVVTDPVHPFEVETPTVNIQVLGTTFNLKAYAGDEMTAVTLATGKIEVTTPEGEKRELNPLQQLVYSQTRSVQIKEIRESAIDQWRHRLVFENASPEEIIRTLERQYNLDFDRKTDTSLLSERYTVGFYRDDSVDQILHVLSELIEGISFRQEKNKVQILSDRS